LNTTFPVGEFAFENTEAVKFTACPKVDESADTFSLVNVASLLTVWSTGAEVLVANEVSP
jgi:hypothetical protein